MWRPLRRAWWHIRGRIAEVRAQRALERYRSLAWAKEKYFSRRDAA